MARDLKFRAWDEKEKRMTTPCLIIKETETNICVINETPNYSYWYNKIMQFTGLQDKNGVDIYEGDLLNTADGILLVIWHYEMATFGLRKNGWMFTHFFGETLDPKDCECIGNIYMNPDLIILKK